MKKYLEEYVMTKKISLPKTIRIGKDALISAEKDICVLGKKALIVCGKSMIRQGHMKTLTDILNANSIAWSIFSDISGEPTDAMIEKGKNQYTEDACDFVIGFGGGSPLDAAKAISAFSVCNGSISDYVGNEIACTIPPIVAIPTTAGTGSEVTQFTIITDTKTDVKMLLKGSSLIPTVAIVDPVFSVMASESVTVAAGLDALTHAVEAYTSRKAYEQSDRYALSAVKRIFQFFPLTLQDMRNEEYREQMSIAAFEAGVSFSNSSVTLVHGMSRPLGGLFHIPHGLSNAMLLNVCLEYALPGAYDRFAELGRYIGVADKNINQEAATAFLSAVKELCEVCKVPTLAQYGVDKAAYFSQISAMSQAAMQSGSPANTGRAIDEAVIAELYGKLWH